MRERRGGYLRGTYGKKNSGLLDVWENGELDFLAWSLLVEDSSGTEGHDNLDYRSVSWFWVEHLLFLISKVSPCSLRRGCRVHSR